MKSLYVVVVEVNREHTGGIEDRMELKAYLDHLVRNALGYRGKITGSELIKGEDVIPVDASLLEDTQGNKYKIGASIDIDP